MRERFAWISTLLALIAAGMALWAFRPSPTAPEMRVELTTPPTSHQVSLAISRDGRSIAYVGLHEGTERLWVRSLDTGIASPVPGTDRATFPFWSPDGRSIGFFADESLKIVDRDGGSVRRLAGAGNPGGGTWNSEGTILFSPSASLPIFRVSAEGGERLAVTELQAGEIPSHRYPQFLPDGQHFLYFANGTDEARGVYVGRLDRPDGTRLLDADSAAIYAAPGYLIFSRLGGLFAQPFNTTGMRLEGSPVRIGDVGMVTSSEGSIFPAVTASTTGTIAFRPGAADGGWQWLILSRSGDSLEVIGNPVAEPDLLAALSRDQRRLAVSRRLGGNPDIWLINLPDGRSNRFTFDPASDSRMLWSPDGRRLVFDSNRNGTRDFYQKPADGSGGEQLLLSTPQTKYLSDWSSNGRTLLYHSQNQQPTWSQDIMALPMAGSRTPFPVVQTRSNEEGAQFSPDGKWLAYESNESGRSEIYVQAFASAAGKFQISSDGGRFVRWRLDGLEMFYRSLDGELMAVSVDVTQSGAVQSGVPRELFRIPEVPYFVLADGERFLTIQPVRPNDIAPITVILNWDPISRR